MISAGENINKQHIKSRIIESNAMHRLNIFEIPLISIYLKIKNKKNQNFFSKITLIQ
jgi:hypothetical protein